MLIDETGARLGEFLTRDALDLARDRGLDLIEVAPNADPPVARIGDYGRIKYERQKKQQAARKNQKATAVKQIKVRPKTDDHDMQVRIKRTRQFLGKGHTVKVVVWFRGREHAHHDIGEDQCLRIADACGDLGRIDQPPRMEGRNMTMTILPTGNIDRRNARDDDDDDDDFDDDIDDDLDDDVEESADA